MYNTGVIRAPEGREKWVMTDVQKVPSRIVY
jgi:hypothetical protein